MSKIQKTKNFGIFKTVKGNRVPKLHAVKRIRKSIERNNMLHANPIIVNEKMEVIDGQHRLLAAQQLNTDIYYVVNTPGTLMDIQLLNANMKAWGMKQFLESYITMGHKEYITYKEFLEQHGFPMSITAFILANPDGKKTGISHKFREGEFVVADLKYSQSIAEEINNILQFAHPEVKKSNRFYDAYFIMRRADPQYPTQLYSKLSQGTDKIYRMETAKEYLRFFEDILNKGRYGKRIVLF